MLDLYVLEKNANNKLKRMQTTTGKTARKKANNKAS